MRVSADFACDCMICIAECIAFDLYVLCFCGFVRFHLRQTNGQISVILHQEKIINSNLSVTNF